MFERSNQLRMQITCTKPEKLQEFVAPYTHLPRVNVEELKRISTLSLPIYSGLKK